MRIKKVEGEIIQGSRGENTIKVLIKTRFGTFVASSPSGKSTGRGERQPYNNSIEKDIQKLIELSEKLQGIEIEKFGDLKKIEGVVVSKQVKNKTKNKLGKTGANTLYALEASILKALAVEKGKEVWEIINEKASKFPSPVGNCIGGGLHSDGRGPDFQEFLSIPETDNFSDSVFLMRKAYQRCGEELEVREAREGKNDENAWKTSLSNEEVLKIMSKVKEGLEEESGEVLKIGIDIAASTFHTGLYEYKNKEKRLNNKEQVKYVLDLIDKYRIDYIEDPLNEEDFRGFSKLRYEAVRDRPTSLIVGDDLTVSQLTRVKKAIEENSVNAIILKPNQVGSLIELAKVISLANKNSIKTIMSHRSGETMDSIIADLAFGFQTDYIKTGVIGKEREVKLERLKGIERDLGKE